MRMLFFDGLVGNNDRHMYNWGILRNIFEKQKETFSPIYDTARGLLWNKKEIKINDIVKDEKVVKEFVLKYCNNCKPKIGIDGEKTINHFDLIEKYQSHYINDKLIVDIFANDLIRKVVEKIDIGYKKLLSDNRCKIIKEILLYRYSKIKEILKWEIK